MTYASHVRQLLAAVNGDYTAQGPLLDYLARLIDSRRRAAGCSAWRLFARYLREEHGKEAAEIEYVNEPVARSQSPSIVPEVLALRALYRWARQEHEVSSFRLAHARFQKRDTTRTPVEWTISFGEAAEHVLVPPELSDALNTLWVRAGQPRIRGGRIWPDPPLTQDECSPMKLRRLLGADLCRPTEKVHPEAKQVGAPRIVVPDLPDLGDL